MDTQPAITASLLLLTPELAADTLGLARSRVCELMRDRQIRSVKIGRSAHPLREPARLRSGPGAARRHRTCLTRHARNLTSGPDLPALMTGGGSARMS